jgi:hypothetical protein
MGVQLIMTDTIKTLISNLRVTKSVTISGAVKLVIGMARYATLNNPESEYVKVSFSDGSGMYFPVDEDIAFVYSKKLDSIEGINIETIGTDESIMLNDHTYKLVNGNDYQYVKEFYLGTILELEGEVRFSDYEDSDGNVLSLGITVVDGKRADVLATLIEISELV